MTVDVISGKVEDGDRRAARPECPLSPALMLNMQDKAKYAFRLLTFDPLTHALTVKTYYLNGAPAEDIPDCGPISFTLENAY